MKKTYIILAWLLVHAGVSVAQQGVAPTVIGCAAENNIIGNYNITYVIGQPIWSSIPATGYKTRCGFPYDASYLKNTFIGKFECSKGYYADYIALQWSIGSNTNKIGKFVVSRRAYKADGSNEYQVVASLDASTRNWQDEYAEASVLYEYKVYAAGVYNLADSLMLNYITGIGFRLPVGTATGRITYSGGTAVKGVTVLAGTTPAPPSYATQFDGKSSGLFIDESTRASLTSADGFTFQAWAKNSSTIAKDSLFLFDKNAVTSLWAYNNMLNFKYAGLGTVSLSLKAFAGAYFHVSAMRELNTLSLVISTDDTTLVSKKTFTAKTLVENAAGLYVGRSSNADKSYNWLGCIDDIRVWDKALTLEDIRRDYNRYISGDEAGLSVYYQLNEGVGNTAYDLTHSGNKFNGNDAAMKNVEWTSMSPASLGYKGVTDQDGNFIIARLPFAANGSTYKLTPLLGVHKFEPSQALRFFSAGSTVSNNVDFTDKSSFVFKGVVFYDKSTFPVEGVNIMIDDNYAYKSRNLVASDVNGEFAVDVPIGFHKITMVKQGHVFSQGVFPPVSYKDTVYDFQENIVERIRFYDATKALLVGRVVGGSVNGDKSLGYGLSTSNLGHSKIVLKTVKPGVSLRSAKTAKGLDSSYVETLVEQINNNAKNTTRYVLGSDVEKNIITIYPDTATGEYAVLLPPEQYIVSSVVAGNLDMVSDQYTFDNSQLGTFSLDVNKMDSSEYTPKDAKNPCIYMFNKRFSFVWLEKPQMEVTQNDSRIFGSPSLIYNKGDGNKETIAMYDSANNKYTFGYPVFAQGQPYTFKINVFEEYINKLYKNKIERIPVTNAKVFITNEFSEITGEVSDSINAQGTMYYRFIGGLPNTQANFTKPITMKCDYKRGANTQSQSIVWDKSFSGIVIGGKNTGANFITAGPIDLITILRDPPGSNSYSYLEKGTTIVKKEETTKATLYNMETGLSMLCGVELETAVGLGFTVTTNMETTNTISLGVKHSSSSLTGSSVERTYTTTQRWQTSCDPAFVGPMADVFIGNSTNIIFGATQNVTILRDTTVKNGLAYKIGTEMGYRMSPSFSTSFQFTQNHIVNYLIPNLKTLRASLFDSKPTIYKTHKPATDPDYCKNSSTKIVNNILVGDSYDVDYVKQRAPGDTTSVVDSIGIYNTWISNWENLMAQNEREKVNAIKDRTGLVNRSFDAGSKFENTSTSEELTSNVISTSGETFLTGGGQFGFQLLGAGFLFEFNNEIGGSKDQSTTNDTTRALTYGYVLDDEDAGDYLTVDIFDDKSGHGPIFKTLGGQTSCPYEDGSTAQYFEPNRKHNLGDATMRVEVPEISVTNNYQVDVPSTQAAVFDISLRNNSEAGSAVRYELAVVDNSNPNGAIVKVDGAILGNGRNYAIPAGGELRKKLTVEKGVADVMKYENIGIVLRSMCQADPTDDWDDISDTISVSVEFVPSCTPLTLALPLDKWTLNTATGTVLNTRVTDFNKNDGNFVAVYLEYKESSSSQWKTLSAFFPDTVSAAYKNYGGTKQLIKGSDIQMPWNTEAMEDRTWDLRAKSMCLDNIFSLSAVSSGIKDMRRPQAFGTPQPTDGILSAGEDLMIRFSEPLESGLVSKKNAVVQGVLNGAEIDHSASLQLNGDTTYARANGFSFCEQSVTLEFWMQRDTGSKPGTIFAKGSGRERFEVEATSATSLRVWLDSVSYDLPLSRCITSESPATAWHHYAVVFDAEAKTLAAYGDGVLLSDKVEVTFDPRARGPVFVGCDASGTNFVQANIHDLRLWNTARTQNDIGANRYTQLTGNEANLLAYWPLDEGRGTLATDRANSNNMNLRAGWNISPRGNAITFNGKKQVLVIDGKEVVINAERDATIEFWLKAAKPAKRSCIVYNGLQDSAGNGKPSSFGVYAEPTGDLSISSYGNTFTVATAVLDNQWHHFALVIDRLSTIRSYVDGTLQKTVDNSLVGDLNFVQMSLGAKRQYVNDKRIITDSYFAGSIDELRVWQSARRANLIDRYMNSKLNGDEQALVLYYPFEAYVDMMGMKTLSTSLKDKTKPETSADATNIGTPAFTTETPAVRDARPVQTLDATVVANGDQMLIELPADMAVRYEKRTLDITALNVQDKNGNNLVTNIQWIAFVDKNTVVWDRKSVEISTSAGAGESFTVQVLNKGGASKSFAIGNLPAWLSVSSQSGTVQPNSFASVTFTVLAGVNIGDYQHNITLSSDYGYDEVLQVNLSVKAKAPAWTVNPASYQFTMNVFGSVKINGEYSADESDMVAAFVGDECRGMVKLEYLADFDLTEAVLPIFSNTERGDSITLLVWDASEGKIYSNVTPVYSFNADTIHGSPDKPVLIECDNSLLTSYTLNKGWNWLSVNVQNPKSNAVQNLFAAVGSEGDEIKGQRSVFDKYSKTAGWSGSLTAAGGIRPQDMYKMKLAKAGTAKINGTPVVAQNTPLTIAAGWNWLGYVPQYNMTVAEALASYGPVAGDIIKSQKQFSMYYDRIGWVGTLKVLEPGKGYMLKTKATSQLIYPEQSSLKSSVEVDEIASLNGYNASAFQSNMCIVASVSDKSVSTDGKLLVAYNGSTIVGATSATEGKYFLVAGGNGQQTLTFALFDTLSGTKTAFDNQLAYATDAVQGSVDAPYLLYTSSVLDAVEPANGGIKVSPSVFSNQLSVSGNILESSTVAVRVLDVLGRELYATSIAKASGSFSISLDHIASVLAPGAYSVEVTVGGTKTVTKVVK